MLGDPFTYEPYPPKLVGNIRRMTVGKQSGRASIKHQAEILTGKKIEKNDKRLNSLIQMVKDVYESGERKSSLTEEELKKLVLKVGLSK